MVRTITRWTEEETALLLKLVDQYRNNFKLVASIFPSRSYNQVKGHYFNVVKQKAKAKKRQSYIVLDNKRQITEPFRVVILSQQLRKLKSAKMWTKTPPFTPFKICLSDQCTVILMLSLSQLHLSQNQIEQRYELQTNVSAKITSSSQIQTQPSVMISTQLSQ
ncbi:SANT/Myb_domain [Hexamita inflata]|uniref:SANT/Myb domain n=1 Tax=Hexamita inflata TaxID=28002 RepID=A0AA86PCU7_9EUKA|nr:SANT/Myb domain [Hexamita inflata]